MKKTISYSAIAATAMVLAACSLARTPFSGQPTPTAATSPVLNADLNRDSAVDCNEWQNFLANTFRQHDTDQNGALSEFEYDGLIRTTGLYTNVPLANIDTNFDRSFSFQELDGFSRQAFAARDKNRDCVLAGSELVVAKAKTRRAPSGGAPGPSVSSGGFGGSFTN